VEAHRFLRRRGFHIFLIIDSQMAMRFLALRVGRRLSPRKIPGTHFSQRLSRPRGHNAAGRIVSIEKSNDLTGNRTRNFPACTNQLSYRVLAFFKELNHINYLIAYPSFPGCRNGRHKVNVYCSVLVKTCRP
jgi:hypothetical protein